MIFLHPKVLDFYWSCTRVRINAVRAVFACLLICAVPVVFAKQPVAKAAATRAFSLAEMGSYYVGGIASAPDDIDSRPIRGQMYVEYWRPAGRLVRPPVVFVHGQNQSGVNFTTSLVGADSWATNFIKRGYPTYVVDQVGYGRSGPSATLGGALFMSSDEVKDWLTHPSKKQLWPQARYHHQWPEASSATNQFLASQMPAYLDAIAADRENTAALLGLLEQIGPSVLITHSRAAPFGWLAAEKRPDLVLSIVALEPHGPPYMDMGKNKPSRPLGITYVPFSDQEGTSTVSMDDLLQVDPVRSDVRPCWREKSTNPLPRLERLRDVPILVITGEASYHARYDHCTVDFLRRRDLQVEFLELQSSGVTGNGHMLMLEANNGDIVQQIDKWIIKVSNFNLKFLQNHILDGNYR